MRRTSLLGVAFLISGALALSACARGSDSAPIGNEPAKLERIEGTDLNRVVLTAKAAERIGIQTAPVRELSSARPSRRSVPYSALIYDAEGNTFVYTNPEPLVFVRQPVTVDYIRADRVVFSKGPPTGTRIVTVGVAELYGIDAGVGGNE